MKWEMIHSMKTLEVANLKGEKKHIKRTGNLIIFFYQKLKVEEKTY
jgi:hypothetical protein